ncbi:hypothetical protein SGLAM104S_03248 [Streptomyces glaucescens]
MREVVQGRCRARSAERPARGSVLGGRGRAVGLLRRRVLRRGPRRLWVLRVQQPYRVPSELGHQGAGQPRVEGAAVGDGVLRAGALQEVAEGRAGGRVLAQTVTDELGDALGNPLQVGLLLRDAEHQGVHSAVGAAEGQGAGGGVGEDGAEAEDVAGGGDAVTAHLLGCHETGRADEGAGAGEPAVGDGLQGAGDAEVDDAGAVDGQQDVGRLQVAVDDPRRVDVLQGVGEPGGEDAHRALGQRPVVVADDLLEAGSGDVPGGDPGHGGLGVGVEHGCRPVTTDPPRGLHLLPEPPPELLLRGQLLADQLHGDGPPPVRPGQIDLPHAARTEPPQQPVHADALGVPWPQSLHPRRLPLGEQQAENSAALKGVVRGALYGSVTGAATGTADGGPSSSSTFDSRSRAATAAASSASPKASASRSA